MVSEQQVLVLASGSPRRRLLLGMAGYEFEVDSPDIDETQLPGEQPEEFVIRMAAEKATAVAERAAAGTCVLGFDTAVVLQDRVYGKPDDVSQAAEMLLSLAGRTHTVITGYCLVIAGGVDEERGIDAARVTMRPVSRQQAEDYAATGEPLDKAGAYALQGRGGGFVAAVEGHRSTVIGLPLEHVVDLLTRRGIMPRGGEATGEV
ncbi:MAG: Maf family protein [Acidimicrobiia bacterium]|nr:Maf family protein [Acidimicrobiia bacterium]